MWWLLWVAVLPILWLAPRVSGRAAFTAAALAWTAGGLNTWTYYRELQIPAGQVVYFVLQSAAVFAAAVLLHRVFVLRRRFWLAALSLPCAWVGYEYLLNLSVGTYQNLAYTQMDCLPLVQLAALAGPSGVSFVVLLFPSCVALAGRRPGVALGAAAVVTFAAVFGFGLWHLHSGPTSGTRLMVGFVVSDLPQNTLQETPAEAMRVLHEYAAQVDGLARRGAAIILLPEMTAVVSDSLMPQVDDLFARRARAAGAKVLVSVIHGTPSGNYNEARLYSEAGRLEAAYRKHHLVPVLEDRTRPGAGFTFLRPAAGVIGIGICKDMDYLELARRYGAGGAGLLLVPAWDFGRDAWLHSRMAILRGIENGFHIARVARNGRITVSDTRGRVLSERPSSAGRFTTLVAPAATAHSPTLYTAWGDWFAWVNLAALAGLLAVVPRSGIRVAGHPS